MSLDNFWAHIAVLGLHKLCYFAHWFGITQFQGILKHLITFYNVVKKRKITFLWTWKDAFFFLANFFCCIHFSASLFFSVAADWQIMAEVPPTPGSPVALCDPLVPQHFCCRYDRVTSGPAVGNLTQRLKRELFQGFEGQRQMCFHRNHLLSRILIKLEAFIHCEQSAEWIAVA